MRMKTKCGEVVWPRDHDGHSNRCVAERLQIVGTWGLPSLLTCIYEDASSMSVDPASIPGLVPQQQQSGGVLDNVPQLRDKP